MTKPANPRRKFIILVLLLVAGAVILTSALLAAVAHGFPHIASSKVVTSPLPSVELITATPAPDGWVAYSRTLRLAGPNLSTGTTLTLRYPQDYTLYEDQIPTVDGVLAPAPDSLALRRSTNPSFVLSIAYKLLEPDVTLAQFAARDDPCVAGTGGQPYLVAGQPALIFTDTPCGPYGSTVIYTVYGQLGYRIETASHDNYRSVRADVVPILDTLEFSPK